MTREVKYVFFFLFAEGLDVTGWKMVLQDDSINFNTVEMVNRIFKNISMPFAEKKDIKRIFPQMTNFNWYFKVVPCGNHIYFLIMKMKGRHAEFSTVLNRVEYCSYF